MPENNGNRCDSGRVRGICHIVSGHLEMVENFKTRVTCSDSLPQNKGDCVIISSNRCSLSELFVYKQKVVEFCISGNVFVVGDDMLEIRVIVNKM